MLRHRIKIPGFQYNSSNTNKKGEYFPPEQRYGVNQIPMPVVFGMDNTWDDNGWVTTNVSQPDSGLHKRIFSIKVLHQISVPKPDQIYVIFSVAGNIISDVNKIYYSNNVRIYWQEKVRADVNFCRKWEMYYLEIVSYKYHLKRGNINRDCLFLFKNRMHGQIT